MSDFSLYIHENGTRFDKVTKDDLAKLLDLKKESWKTTHNISLVSMEWQMAWYDALSKEDIHAPKNLVLIASAETSEKKNSIPVWLKVGVFKYRNIDWYNQKADVAWDIFYQFRKQGLGKKLVEAGVDFAREVLNLRKLNAEILENNPASMKCALAAGFEQEGVKKEEVFRQDKFLNSHVMGLFISRLQSKKTSCS